MSRERAISRIKALLTSGSYPRLQMALLVALTGALGFLVSFVLLHQGLTTMWLRYLLAMAAAYLGFLGLLGLWLRWPSSLGDLVDGADLLPHGAGGGGGAPPLPRPSGGFSGLGGPADVPDFDPVGLAVLVIAFGLAILFSSLWLVWTAPALFAELLLDAALAAGLYHRLKKLPRRHWLETAIRGTVWPYLITTLLVVAIGWGMSHYLPGAQSLGDVIAAPARADLVAGQSGGAPL